MKNINKFMCVSALTALPMSTMAGVNWDHNGTVKAGDAYAKFNLTSPILNSIEVGYGNVSFNTSDKIKLGLDIGTQFGGLIGSVSYDYTSTKEHIVGVDTSLDLAGFSFSPSASWNLNHWQYDGSVKIGLDFVDVKTTAKLNFNINDMSRTGSEVSVNYNWNVPGYSQATITPAVTAPFDADWNSEGLVFGLNLEVDLLRK